MATTHRTFWTYQAPAPLAFDSLPAAIFSGTRDEWESFSPGMRREIVRSYFKQSNI